MTSLWQLRFDCYYDIYWLFVSHQHKFIGSCFLYFCNKFVPHRTYLSLSMEIHIFIIFTVVQTLNRFGSILTNKVGFSQLILLFFLDSGWETETSFMACGFETPCREGLPYNFDPFHKRWNLLDEVPFSPSPPFTSREDFWPTNIFTCPRPHQ